MCRSTAATISQPTNYPSAISRPSKRMKLFSLVYSASDLVCQPSSLLDPHRSLIVFGFRHVLMHAIRVHAAIGRQSSDEWLKRCKGKIFAYSHGITQTIQAHLGIVMLQMLVFVCIERRQLDYGIRHVVWTNTCIAMLLLLCTLKQNRLRSR